MGEAVTSSLMRDLWTELTFYEGKGMQNQQKKAVKWDDPLHLHVSMEMPTGCCYGEGRWVGEKTACWGASVRYLYTSAHSLGNKHEELELCVQLQGYSLIGVTETR